MSLAIDRAGGDTLSERAAQRIEADIVTGALAPGSKLGISELAAQYGIGATPVREGLSRLVARGLIIAIGQRGFRVSEISRADLADITRLRTLVECEAFRLSLRHGDSDWEAGIVAAQYRLRRCVGQSKRGLGEGRPEFDARHKEFHTALIAACGSPRMLDAHSALYDQAYRYRRLMMARIDSPAEFLRDHDELAELALNRSMKSASARLADHIASTLRHVYPQAGMP